MQKSIVTTSFEPHPTYIFGNNEVVLERVGKKRGLSSKRGV
jgi:hypothetical protein